MENPKPTKLGNIWSTNLMKLLVAVYLQLGWIGWILANTTWIGFWTLPIGLTLFGILLSELLLSAVLLWKYRNYWFFGAIVGYGILLFEDFAFHPFQNLEIEEMTIKATSPIQVLTWNIGGQTSVKLQNHKEECIQQFLQKWQIPQMEQFLLFQEFPSTYERTLEQNLNIQCHWSPYFNSQKRGSGLLICADPSWNFTFEHHRVYKNDQRYGYLQVELQNQHTGQKLNLLDIHLESLYLTARNSKAIDLHSSVLNTLWSNPKPKTWLKILEMNTKNQEEAMESVFNMLSRFKDPTIIGGDFNSPSTMWFHQKLQNEFQDAHLYAGNGWGTTVNRLKILNSRIDYIYASTGLKWVNTALVHHSVRCSDHFPVSAFIQIP